LLEAVAFLELLATPAMTRVVAANLGKFASILLDGRYIMVMIVLAVWAMHVLMLDLVIVLSGFGRGFAR
jgi:hypothetical protein